MKNIINKLWFIYKFVFVFSFIAFNIAFAGTIIFFYLFFGIDGNLFTFERIFLTELSILLMSTLFSFAYLLKSNFDEY